MGVGLKASENYSAQTGTGKFECDTIVKLINPTEKKVVIVSGLTVAITLPESSLIN